VHLVRHIVLVLVLLAVAPAAASAACGGTIIDDYMDDGVVDGKYSQSCYDQALDGLDDDLREYTNAETDIAAAKLRQKKADEKAAQPPPPPATQRPEPAQEPEDQPDRSLNDTPDPPASSQDEGDDAVAVGVGGGDDGGGGEPPAPAPVEEVGQSDVEQDEAVAGPPDTGAVLGTIAAVEPIEVGDVRTEDGPLQQALRDVGPSNGGELPLPVIVLGGLAILLMSVGAGGLVLRRMQSR
jgi:hypothetical protein